MPIQEKAIIDVVAKRRDNPSLLRKVASWMNWNRVRLPKPSNN